MHCKMELITNVARPRAQVSIVLLDWNVRESFHALHYLNEQTVARDLYEIIWVEFYDHRPAELLEQARRAQGPLIDKWLVLGYPADVVYHKHRMYNAGLVLAEGEVCVFCDSDAMFQPTFVASLLRQFRRDPRSVVHLDQVRNYAKDYYPFNYPTVEQVLGRGCVNWTGTTTAGVVATEDMLHKANYGACMAARRDDLIAIGGADEHLDYLGYICGPYEMTFRLVNHGRREVWLHDEYLYHTWHPNTSGYNIEYKGPDDGRGMSLAALEARDSGRVMPLRENAAVRALRGGMRRAPAADLLALMAHDEDDAWRVAVPAPAAPAADQEVCLGHYVAAFQGAWYAVPCAEGPFEPKRFRDKCYVALKAAASRDELLAILQRRCTLMHRTYRRVRQFARSAAARLLGTGAARTRRLALFGVLVWAAAVTALATLPYRGVLVEPVTLPLPDGTEIVGTLYRPRTHRWDQVPAAVVAHGTAVSHRSCAPGLSLPLARNGVLTLAIDLPGHGRSGGSLPRQWFTDPAATLESCQAHPEIDAAMDFLLRRPEYLRHRPICENRCLFLIGHSLGGWMVTNAGYQRDEAQAVVSIGAAYGPCAPGRPRDYLILTGGTDQLCPLARGLDQIARARGGATLKPEAPFGDFFKGQERRLIYIGRVNHFTELDDPRVTLRVLEWVATSIETDFAHPDQTPFLLLETGAVLAALLGGLLAATAVLATLGQRLIPRAVLTIPERPWRAKVRLLALAGLVAAGVPLAAALGDHVEIGPVFALGPAVGLVTILGIAGLAVAPRAARPIAGPSRSDAGTAGLLIGLIALAIAFAWFGVAWHLSWTDMLPTPPRLVTALALWPMLLPGCLGLAAAVTRIAAQPTSFVSRARTALAWLTLPASLALGHVFLAADTWPLFIVPVSLVGASFAVPLPLWLLPNRPGMPLARAVCHAGAAAWLLGCHLPFVHAG